MLRVSDLSVAIGAVPVVRNASLALDEGEMCGLIGRNGAGKTTLLRALMGALPASGKAELDSTDLLQLPAHRRAARGIGYMPEDRRLVPEFSVEENVRLPTWSVAIAGAEQRLSWIYYDHAGGRALPSAPRARAVGWPAENGRARACPDGRHAHIVARRAVRGRGPGAGAPARRSAGQPEERACLGPDCRVRTRAMSPTCWHARSGSSAAR